MQILGVRIDNVSMDEALEKIRGFLNDGQQHYVATLNPDFLVKAYRDQEFRIILNKSDLNVADGFGLILASWFLGESLKSRVVGIDLIKNCKSNLENLKVFLLGGFNGAAEKIARDWPAVVGFSEDTEGAELFVQITQRQPNLLFVALGAPKQEKWIVQNLAKILSVKVAIGVGSAFDLLSGQIKRAPKIFQALGLEWLWRTFHEPRRFKKAWRSVVIFPLLFLKQKIVS